MAEHKRITLHPVKDDGTIDIDVNLYPKTLLRGIVDDTGEEVEVATAESIEDMQIEINKKSNIEDIPTIVNEGIASGSISIPTSGTKLYKHSIVIKSSAIPVTNKMTMTLISLNNTEITSLYNVHSYDNYSTFKMRKIGQYSTGLNYYDFFVSFEAYPNLHLLDKNNNTLISITEDTITSLIDTVTEL